MFLNIDYLNEVQMNITNLFYKKYTLLYYNIYSGERFIYYETIFKYLNEN